MHDRDIKTPFLPDEGFETPYSGDRGGKNSYFEDGGFNTRPSMQIGGVENPYFQDRRFQVPGFSLKPGPNLDSLNRDPTQGQRYKFILKKP